MKTIHKLFSTGWRKANQFKIMVAALMILMVMPFLLYNALTHDNMVLAWIDLGIIGLGMLLIILAA
jgi:O-antigen ligase